MTKAPKRSGIAAMWAALIDWAPVRAARSFLGHIGLGAVCMVGIWLSEQAFLLFFQPREPTFFVC
jgi:hypothetical protein